MKRGFTLIELLVVIAIIGILSSVVLASLNTARTRGACASGDDEACAKLDPETVKELQDEPKVSPPPAPAASLPEGVEKFNPEPFTTCYTYRSASISCVR